MGTIERDSAADNVRRAAKRAKPEAVADHGDGVTSNLLIVFRSQHAPAHWRHAEHREEFSRYELNGGQLCLTLTVNSPVHPCDPAHRSHTAADWRCASKLLEHWIRKLIRGPG